MRILQVLPTLHALSLSYIRIRILQILLHSQYIQTSTMDADYPYRIADTTVQVSQSSSTDYEHLDLGRRQLS